LNNSNIKYCHIVGAADFAADRLSVRDGDMVIACDAGLYHLEKAGVMPDIILGDFDSVKEEPCGDNVIRHPVRKDNSDSFLALEEGYSRGYRNFIFHGCTGGERFDHTLANIQTLSRAVSLGCAAWLFAPNYTATVMGAGELVFDSEYKGDISVFAVGGAARISERGLNYEAENLTLLPDNPVGVSNAFIGKEAVVRADCGRILVIWRWNTEKGIPVLRGI